MHVKATSRRNPINSKPIQGLQPSRGDTQWQWGDPESSNYITWNNDLRNCRLTSSFEKRQTFDDMTADTIAIDQTLNAPPDQVWDAITNPVSMREWYFDIPDFTPVVGCKVDWWAGAPGGKQWQHRACVEEVVPSKVIRYTWKYPGYEGLGQCNWQLVVEGEESTRLRFSFEFLTPFQSDQPELARENFVMGWNAFIQERLPAYFRKN